MQKLDDMCGSSFLQPVIHWGLPYDLQILFFSHYLRAMSRLEIQCRASPTKLTVCLLENQIGLSLETALVCCAYI